jgi:tellurite resistance protein TerC
VADRHTAVGRDLRLSQPEVDVDPELGPWVVLAVIVGGMLALDLLVLNRHAVAMPFRKAALWSAIWVTLGVGFGAFVVATQGGVVGGEYLAGYLIELSLSVDNLFVFALIFGAFGVPAIYQHRLLFWGILGAIVFRALFISAGIAILSAAHWVIYLLGVLLVVTGIRLAWTRDHAVHPERNPALRIFRRVVPMTEGFRGQSFVVREGGRRLATPLLAVLVAIEATDIMFALDSIPAVFAVTTDPFVVFSSNLFAILGLRSMYFLLAGMLDRFVYLKLGLAALLVFAGLKILAGVVHIDIPILLSLSMIVLILATSIVASLIATHPRKEEIAMPVVRVISGMAFGLVALGVFALAGGAAMGQPWVGPVVGVTLVSGAGIALASGLAALTRGAGSRRTETIIRIGVAALLGTAVVAVLALPIVLRIGGDLWLAVDGAVLIATLAFVVLGIADLRRVDARPPAVRGWMTVGAATLVALAVILVLD